MTDDKKPGDTDYADDDGWGEAADQVAALDRAADHTPPPEPAYSTDHDVGAPPSIETSGEIESVSSEEFEAELAAPATETAPSDDVTADSASSSYEPEPYTPPDYDDDLRSAVGIDSGTKRDTRTSPAKRSSSYGSGSGSGGGSSGGGSDNDDDEGEGDQPRVSRRTLLLIILFSVLSVTVGIFILLGTLNSRYYYFQCGTEQITARRGRSFPPWGTSKLGGPQWEPISIPANAECDSAKLSERSELESMYFDALREQAENVLESKRPSDVDLAEKQLQQALLLARPAERKDVRSAIERLRGDVEYWRARNQLERAADELSAAAKKFTESAERKPRHVSDAAAWAEFAEHMASELGLGPVPLRPDVPDTDTGNGSYSGDAYRDGGAPVYGGPDAGPGVALPLESDAGVPPADAAVPTGGVLL